MGIISVAASSNPAPQRNVSHDSSCLAWPGLVHHSSVEYPAFKLI